MSGSNQWRQTFANRLDGLRSQWVDDFKRRLDSEVEPAFDELAGFVREHGFQTSSPLNQPERRSFKFELNENAFVLLTLSHESMGDVSLRCEYFAPGAQPGDLVHRAPLQDVDRDWATSRFQEALDAFVTAMEKGGKVEGSFEQDLISV